MKVKTCRTATDTCSRKPILLFKGKQQKPNQNAYTCQPNKPFSASNQTTTSHLNYIFPLFSPHNRRGGEKYCFGADPVGVGVLVVYCLHTVSWTNWWSLTKLAQTHYSEGGKKWRFWWHWPHFQGHTSTWKFSPKKLVCTLSLEANDGFWPKFIYIVTFAWIQDLIRF